MGQKILGYKRGWGHSKGRGSETSINCSYCGRLVPKYRTFATMKGFGITDPSLRKELGGMGVDMSFSATKMLACPACARHRNIVKKKGAFKDTTMRRRPQRK